MKKKEQLMRGVSVVLGLTSIAFFVFDFFVFESLRPKMVRFEAISGAEEKLINWVGVGLLIFLAFCLLSLYQIARYLKYADKVTLFSLSLIVGGVLSLLFIFGDVALLSDIGKQYRHGLAQPEWLMIYLVVGFQFVTAIVFTYLHLSGFLKGKQLKYVAQDSNIFLMVQYVGVICGLLGLSSSSLGFVFPRAWSLQIHTTTSSIILLIPYTLVTVYWIFIKFQEKTGQWFDEKQLQDIGKSAFLTLVLNVIFMTVLFIINYNSLSGVVSILWLPLYLFSVLFLFSSGNLYFSAKD